MRRGAAGAERGAAGGSAGPRAGAAAWAGCGRVGGVRADRYGGQRWWCQALAEVSVRDATWSITTRRRSLSVAAKSQDRRS
jgi:hypothetical protein